eukprot:TRINITY_DN31630_c0_g1_i1.p1 TRINITY_DN31630_c0_g1~~TRINITY_DN31630_c0_g1_i1.p1  ORF type:complete len:483 (+),score=115.93 TRINITY_DN31630_c0_g1_i1:75-1523(+)
MPSHVALDWRQLLLLVGIVGIVSALRVSDADGAVELEGAFAGAGDGARPAAGRRQEEDASSRTKPKTGKSQMLQEALVEVDHAHALAAKGQAGVIYGIMTCNLPAWRKNLQAQRETWAAGLVEQGRLFAVSGRRGGSQKEGLDPDTAETSDPDAWLNVTGCQDGQWGFACKEQALIETGHRWGASWLVVLGEDNYVDTPRLENALATADKLWKDEPLALGILGCKLPQESGYCPKAASAEGFCGGGGYAINQAALHKVLVEGSKEDLQEAYASKRGIHGDQATSCALRQQGVELIELPKLVGSRMMHKKDFHELFEEDVLSMHYMTPEVMKWVHANKRKRPAKEIALLEQAAFDEKDCCCWHYDEDETCRPEADSEAGLTTLANEAALGDKHLDVLSTLGFHAGDHVLIGEEDHVIEGKIGLHLAEKLRSSYDKGTVVRAVKASLMQSSAVGAQAAEAVPLWQKLSDRYVKETAGRWKAAIV